MFDLKQLSKLPLAIVIKILKYLDLVYLEYHFFSKKRDKGLTIIKYPLFNWFFRRADSIGFIVDDDLNTE
jgi:hypothetical protein